MKSRVLVGAVLLALCGVRAEAQIVAAKKGLTLEGAKKAIAAVEDAARKAGATGVVAVVDDGGNLIAVARIDGTFSAGANIAIGKARTAVQFKKPTKFFEDVVNAGLGGKGRTAMATVDFTPLQGGIPVILEGQVVGGVGVSGAMTAAQDEEFALAGAAALGSTN